MLAARRFGGFQLGRSSISSRLWRRDLIRGDLGLHDGAPHGPKGHRAAKSQGLARHPLSRLQGTVLGAPAMLAVYYD